MCVMLVVCLSLSLFLFLFLFLFLPLFFLVGRMVRAVSIVLFVTVVVILHKGAGHREGGF